MSTEQGTSEVRGWPKAVGLLALLVPAGIFVAVAHETGFFGAIGLRADYAFMAILPIPIEELVRIGFILAIVAFVSVLVLVAMLGLAASTFFGGSHLFGAALKYLKNGRGSVGAKSHPDVRRSRKPQSLGVIAFVKSKARILHLAWKIWQKRRFARAMTVFLSFYAVCFVLLFVIIPSGVLLMDYLSTEGPLLGVIAALGLTACAVLLLSSEAANLLRGGRIHVELPRRIATLLLVIAFSFSALVAYSAGSRIGYAMLLPDKNGNLYPAAMHSSAIADCPQAEGALLVRSYTSGSIYFRPGQLIWLSDSDRACSVIRIKMKTIEEFFVTPTLFEYPLEAFKFRAIRVVD